MVAAKCCILVILFVFFSSALCVHFFITVDVVSEKEQERASLWLFLLLPFAIHHQKKTKKKMTLHHFNYNLDGVIEVAKRIIARIHTKLLDTRCKNNKHAEKKNANESKDFDFFIK